MKYIFSFFVILFSISAYSQVIHGKVYGIDSKGIKEVLPAANVYFSDNKQGTSTDLDGNYSLNRNLKGKKVYLVAAYVGYISDSVLVNKELTEVEFLLREDETMLDEVRVLARQQGTSFSKITPLKTEMISSAGLMKMACCNLSESFENSATVTVGFSDAISGAKQVQLLGLSGIYSQMLAENIPTLRGPASTFGWSYTPGFWLESIQISKGASSVTNGYESVSGQINLEFKKPDHVTPIELNLFADQFKRVEANLNLATQVSKKLWTGLLLHASKEDDEHDRNDDGFLDMPRTKFFTGYNRWIYENPEKNMESKTGVKFLYENREGGQLSSIPDRYVTSIDNKNVNVYNKFGFALGHRPGTSMGIINSFTYHNQESQFGRKSFEAKLNSYYANVLFSSFIRNTNHQYTTGASFQYDNFKTSFKDDLLNQTPLTSLDREEVVPGVFAQYTYTYLEKLSFILGARIDNNSYYGTLFTPRTNLKYNITDDIIFRASAGKGYRAPNVIVENIGLMASSRNFNLSGINELDIEEAWNYGVNLSFYIPIWDERKVTLSLDYFKTDFKNQAIIDIERNRNQVYFYNLDGKSYANAWQADLSVTPFKGFEVFAAFRYNKTKFTLRENDKEYLVEKPLTSRYRGLLNLSYATNFKRWVFDFTAQLNGPSRLPSLDGYNTANSDSPAFPVYFAQITRNSKRFDIYIGIENIFDFIQDNPIIEPSNPFSKNFDSSMIWGPLMGRKIYAGIRLRIGELK